MSTTPTANPKQIVGLVPAAGWARRLGPLPYSKELAPIDDGAGGTKAVCESLLDHMAAAGVARTYVVIRSGKWDIREHLGDGAGIGLELNYIVEEAPVGAPQSLDHAYSYLREDRVALGFPDIVYPGTDAFGPCLTRQESSGADVVLGLFPTDRPEAVDMVAVDATGTVTDIVIKQPDIGLSHFWAVAVWTFAFTEFLHDFLADPKRGERRQRARTQRDRRTADRRGAAPGSPERPEIYVGDVIRAAMAEDMVVEAVVVSDEPAVDVGTPEGLAKIVARGD